MILPKECQDGGKIKALVRGIIAQDNPISQFHFVDLAESMKNGGGPACLRLRVVLNDQEVKGVQPEFILNDRRIADLQKWVTRHYRDTLNICDLADYELVKESRAALDKLTQILGLGSIYSFQK